MFLDIMSIEERDDEAGVEHEDVGFEHEDMAEDKPFEHEDLYFDAFGEGSNTPIITDPNDGLPRPADDWVAPAPKMSLDTFICLEDESEYVEVFKEDVSGKNVLVESLVYKTDEAREILQSRRSRYDKDGAQITPRRFKPEQVKEVYGIKVVEVLQKNFVVVAPKRQRCSNLVRQITIAEDIAAGDMVVQPMFTFCKAFKSTSGAYLSLMDKAILSCEHRTPRDIVTEKMIVDRVRRKIKEGNERQQVPVMKSVPTKNPFEGEMEFSPVEAVFKADPKIAPGVNSVLSVGMPSRYSGKQQHVLYVGRDMNNQVFESIRSDVAFHTIYVDSRDYAPEGVSEADLKEFCDSWPRYASYAYLSNNLISAPRHMRDCLLSGENVYVCAKDERDAMFAYNLILREFGKSELHGNMRAEHINYLNRKDQLCRTKDPRDRP